MKQAGTFTRRSTLQLFGAAALGTVAGAALGPAAARATEQDIEGSKQEKKFVLYTPLAPEDGLVKILRGFNTKYPWIDVSEYLRLQTGKLYPKIVEEVRQGVKSCDVLTLSEIALTLDFEQQGFWQPYLSPELATYPAEFKSPVAGLYATSWITYNGIAWNPKNVSGADVPKGWKDLLNPKWAGAVNVKDSNSGSQYAQYDVLKQLYGEDFWVQFFTKQKPIVLPGQQQQYDRVISGDDKINGCAASSAFSLLKEAGAPIELLFPTEGVPVVGLQSGMVKGAPHPHSARLFLDYLYSAEGQKLCVDVIATHSPRPGVAGPKHLPPASEIKAVWPKDLDAYIKGQEAWRKMWKTMGGA